jgi:hypothetical protein
MFCSAGVSAVALSITRLCFCSVSDAFAGGGSVENVASVGPTKNCIFGCNSAELCSPNGAYKLKAPCAVNSVGIATAYTTG